MVLFFVVFENDSSYGSVTALIEMDINNVIRRSEGYPPEVCDVEVMVLLVW